jgi:hypothetical protein
VLYSTHGRLTELEGVCLDAKSRTLLSIPRRSLPIMNRWHGESATHAVPLRTFRFLRFIPTRRALRWGVRAPGHRKAVWTRRTHTTLIYATWRTLSFEPRRAVIAISHDTRGNDSLAKTHAAGAPCFGWCNDAYGRKSRPATASDIGILPPRPRSHAPAANPTPRIQSGMTLRSFDAANGRDLDGSAAVADSSIVRWRYRELVRHAPFRDSEAPGGRFWPRLSTVGAHLWPGVCLPATRATSSPCLLTWLSHG